MEKKFLKYTNKYLRLKNSLRFAQYGGAGAGGGGGDDNWACQACTFANEGNSNACAVCGTAKGMQAGPDAFGSRAFAASRAENSFALEYVMFGKTAGTIQVTMNDNIISLLHKVKQSINSLHLEDNQGRHEDFGVKIASGRLDGTPLTFETTLRDLALGNSKKLQVIFKHSTTGDVVRDFTKDVELEAAANEHAIRNRSINAMDAECLARNNPAREASEAEYRARVDAINANYRPI